MQQIKFIACCVLLFCMNLTVCVTASQRHENSDVVTVVNNLQQDFICSVQLKNFQPSRSSSDGEEYGDKKRRKQGIAIQSMLIASQRSISLPLHIASQVEQYCIDNAYSFDYSKPNQTMTINSKLR